LPSYLKFLNFYRLRKTAKLFWKTAYYSELPTNFVWEISGKTVLPVYATSVQYGIWTVGLALCYYTVPYEVMPVCMMLYFVRPVQLFLNYPT